MRLPSDPSGLSGMRVTVMGLGLNGGGLASARFLLAHGARLVVTDLRDEAILRPSLDALGSGDYRTVLGRHEEKDFRECDFVIKNPAVRPGNPWIAMAPSVETDLSLFFAWNRSPVLGVTGSKGKSSTASALHHCLQRTWPGARLGGNITVSPLTFLHELEPEDPVVLELSSFQLGDLALCDSLKGRKSPSFPPSLGILTNIYRDHQDYYGTMEGYVADKVRLFRGMTAGKKALLFADDDWTARILPDCTGDPVLLSGSGHTAGCSAWLDLPSGPYPDPFTGPRGWMDIRGQAVELVPSQVAIAGLHHRRNLLSAGLAAVLHGMDPATVREALADFSGVEHRLETVALARGVTFINDSAATIPDAALAGVESIGGRIHLITGGTDKNLDLSDFTEIRRRVTTLRLLKGSASEAIDRLLKEAGMDHLGIHDDLDACVAQAFAQARPGDTVLLSPGCASFGMFLNEFDRGRRFKAAVRACTGTGTGDQGTGTSSGSA